MKKVSNESLEKLRKILPPAKIGSLYSDYQTRTRKKAICKICENEIPLKQEFISVNYFDGYIKRGYGAYHKDCFIIKNKIMNENIEQQQLKDTLTRINIHEIVESPYQGRLISDLEKDSEDSPNEIDILAKSIEKNGLMHPVIVRQKDNGKFELIDGHRRLLAYRKLGLGKIKAIIKNYDDKLAQVFSIIGNLERKDLTHIELAIAYQKILDKKIYKTRIELSEALGKDNTFIGDLLNLLKLDNRIIEELARTNLIKDVRLLREIRKIEDANNKGISNKQWDLYRRVVLEKLSRNDVMQVVSYLKHADTNKTKQKSIKSTKTTMQSPFYIKTSRDNINMQLNVKNINKEKREKIMESIEQYVRNLLEQI